MTESTIDWRRRIALPCIVVSFVVESEMHEVILPDGSSHMFYRARPEREPAPDRYLRALRIGDSFAIFDLRTLASELAAEIPGYLERDVPGLVKYTLRPLYPSYRELVDAVLRQARVIGTPEACA